MNLIPLTKEYYIGADKYQWILYKKCKDKKTGKDDFRGYRYFGTLESLLEKTLEMNLRLLIDNESNLKSLVISMSNERKKFVTQVYAACEGIKKSVLLKTK